MGRTRPSLRLSRTLRACRTCESGGVARGFEAITYDSVVEHERLARVLGQLIWATSPSVFYREIARLADEPQDSAILDIPCGGGVAFRGLRREQRLR